MKSNFKTMKRKSIQKCIPLELVKKIDNDLPGIWDKIEKLRNYNKLNNYSIWPKYCYMTVHEYLGILANGDEGVFDSPDGIFLARLAQALAALAPWRISKEIYVMNPEVEEILSEQDDVKVNKDILLTLPYYSFYIKTNDLKINGYEVDGFFVCLDYEYADKTMELRLTYILPDLTWIEFPILLKFKTIQESLDFLYDEGNIPEYKDNETNKDIKHLLTVSLQLILYILSINTDISEDPEQMKIYRPAKNIEAIKNKYSEVRKWNVGFRIGQTIKANKQRIEREQSQPRVGSHSSKRPHMRRGHWHSFWTGPRDGDRKLVVKWVSPMFIGAKEDTPVVYHNVK